MFSVISNLFAMSDKNNASDELMFREVLFTGSKLRFGLSENFSKDFPADALIETLSLDQLKNDDNSGVSETGSVLLLRRWWDFNQQRLFSQTTEGTIMLSLRVQALKEPVTDRLSLIKVIGEQLEQQYAEFNKTATPDFVVAFPQTYESFSEKTLNDQRWISYSTAAMGSSEATLYFVTPLSASVYLEFAFTLMPSSKISIRNFEDQYGRDFIQRIMNTVALKYESRVLQQLGFDKTAVDYSEVVKQLP